MTTKVSITVASEDGKETKYTMDLTKTQEGIKKATIEFKNFIKSTFIKETKEPLI